MGHSEGMVRRFFGTHSLTARRQRGRLDGRRRLDLGSVATAGTPPPCPRRDRERGKRKARDHAAAGRDCCFASEGRAGDVALGCRKCGGNGGKLDSESFLAHLAALVGETARHVAAHATNDRAAIANPSALPGRAWRASEPVDGTPGHTYLVARRVWPAGER